MKYRNSQPPQLSPLYAQAISEIYMPLSTLEEWLSWIGSVHQTEIELGLERVKTVAKRLNLLSPPRYRLIIVGGTNGKGSTVAGLEAIYQAAHYRVGTFTSPVFFKHNEQVRIHGKEATDSEFCQAFEKIEAARGEVSLTPFEFHTLAALLIFQTYALDVVILEVGLGGRLDAVNILDADVAVVTSIGIDHVEWLGPTRESIAYEKAGIFRSYQPAVCGDSHPPQPLIDYAAQQNTPLFCQEREFYFREDHNKWSWKYQHIHYSDLPIPSLATQNMSTVLMTITLLQEQLPVTRNAIDQGLSTVTLKGRIQIKPGPITEIYDVSHNPAAISWLAKQLKSLPCQGKTHAVFSMLADKDRVNSIQAIHEEIDHWYIAPLTVKRAASLELLKQAFSATLIPKTTYFTSIQASYTEAKKQAVSGDRIIVFGSFHTVAEVWKEAAEMQC